jgi:hypothetical protein
MSTCIDGRPGWQHRPVHNLDQTTGFAELRMLLRCCAAIIPSVITAADLVSGEEVVELAELPALARDWLAARISTDEVLWLASLDPEDADRLPMSVIWAVLRSLGAVTPLDPEPEQRVDRALAVVQGDLDATGFGQFRFHATAVEYWPTGLRPVYRATLENGWWDHNVEELDALSPPEQLLRDAALAVHETIIEIHMHAWPYCVAHDGPPLTPRIREAGTEVTVWWHCLRGDHDVAPIGELRPDQVSPLPPSAR